MALDDLAVFIVYMGFISGFFALAGLLEWLTEKVPFLGRLVDRWLDSMEICEMEDDIYETEDDYRE